MGLWKMPKLDGSAAVALIALLMCICGVDAALFGSSRSELRPVTPEMFEQKIGPSMMDIMWTPREPSALQALVSKLTYMRRYKNSTAGHEGKEAEYDEIAKSVQNAYNMIFPGLNNASIEKKILMAKSIYYFGELNRVRNTFYSTEPGDLTIIVLVGILDLFKKKEVKFTYDRKIKCPHHGSPEQHACSICKGSGLHQIKDITATVTLPPGVTNYEMLVAKGEGSYSLAANKYGDLRVLVVTISEKNFIRGPINEYIGSSADLYSIEVFETEEHSPKDETTIEGPNKGELVTYKYNSPEENFIKTELEDPLLKDVYEDLKEKYELTNKDFVSFESELFVCLHGFGLPLRGSPNMRGKLCIKHIYIDNSVKDEDLISHVKKTRKNEKSSLKKAKSMDNKYVHHGDQSDRAPTHNEDESYSLPIVNQYKEASPYAYSEGDL